MHSALRTGKIEDIQVWIYRAIVNDSDGAAAEFLLELHQCYQLQKCLADVGSRLATLVSTPKSAEMNNNLLCEKLCV